MNQTMSKEALLQKVKFDDKGLITAVAQDATTSQVLMVAWMNRDALEETLKGGQVCYWSRSRSSLWRKGETSGHVQMLREIYLDCDGDTLLLKVDQKGPACHTGEISCFFTQIK